MIFVEDSDLVSNNSVCSITISETIFMFSKWYQLQVEHVELVTLNTSKLSTVVFDAFRHNVLII